MTNEQPKSPQGFILREVPCPVCGVDHLWQKAYQPHLFCDECRKIVGVMSAPARAPQHAASDTPTVQSVADYYTQRGEPTSPF